jgi:hypothetical protein
MFWEDYSLIGGGRSGERLGHLAMRFPIKSFAGQVCRYEMLYAPHSHFDLYGNYIPSFCGGISLGSWHNLPDLREAYSREDYPPLIRILIEDGPYGLSQEAAQRYAYHPLEEGYAGKCHLCTHVRQHLFRHARFPELQPAQFYA